jgi:uncharacterized protein (TIGR02271 family)
MNPGTITGYDQLRGRTAYDRGGDKIGEINEVYLDDVTRRPEWVSVKAGLFKGTRLAPLSGARLEDTDRDGGERLILGVDKDAIRDAPNIDDDGHLDEASERQLYAHYGFTWDSRSEGDYGYGKSWKDRRFDDSKSWHHKDAGTSGSDDAMTRSEEELRVDKQRKETGKARLRKYVVTEQVNVQVPVQREQVRVEREPITDANRDAAMGGPDIAEREHEVTLHEERPVVTTEAVPKERVRLEKDTVQDTKTVSGEVRKERIDVDGDAEKGTR